MDWGATLKEDDYDAVIHLLTHDVMWQEAYNFSVGEDGYIETSDAVDDLKQYLVEYKIISENIYKQGGGKSFYLTRMIKGSRLGGPKVLEDLIKRCSDKAMIIAYMLSWVVYFKGRIEATLYDSLERIKTVSRADGRSAGVRVDEDDDTGIKKWVEENFKLLDDTGDGDKVPSNSTDDDDEDDDRE